MVASWVGPLAPTSSPSDTWRAVEGSLHLGVTEVERGLRGIDLHLLEPGPRRVAIGRCIVERLLRRDLAARELGLPFVFRLRLLQRRLGADLGGARLLELELVRLRLDDEEGCTLLHRVAVLVIDLLQEALHPRDQVGCVYRRGITGGFEIAGDLLLHRHRHRDLGRRRRHIAVILPAGAEHERERGCCASDKPRTRSPRPVNRHRATPTSIVEDPHGRRSASRDLADRSYDPAFESGSRFRRLETQPAPEGAGCPHSPVLLSFRNWY
jgi:hypothetical protein